MCIRDSPLSMDKKLVVLALMFFLVVGAFSTALFFDQGSLKQTRATQKCAPDIAKSFLVSLPKDVPPGGSCEVDAVSYTHLDVYKRQDIYHV